MKCRRTDRAMTLIEILIVVSILAILASIAVINFADAEVRAKVSRAQSDMRTVAIGLEAYHVDNNDYPLNPSVPVAGASAPSGIVRTAFNVVPHNITTPVSYLSSRPLDPFRANISNVYGFDEPEYRLEGMLYSYYRIIDEEEWWNLYTRDGIYVSFVAVNSSGPRPAPGGPTQLALEFANRGASAKYGEWLLMAVGPDNALWRATADFTSPGDLGSPLDYPLYPPWGYSFDVPYDPTNGTISWGNITRTQIGSERPGAYAGSTNGGGGNPGGGNNPSGGGGGGPVVNSPGGGVGAAGGGGVGGGLALAPPAGGAGSAGKNSALKRADESAAGTKTAGGGANAAPAKKPETIEQFVMARPQMSPPQRIYDGAPNSYRATRALGFILLLLALLLLGLCLLLRALLKKRPDPLDIDSSLITDELLGRVTDLPKRTTLYLAHSQVTDVGLAKLKECRALKTLNLWNTHVSDMGLRHLKGLPSLGELVLTDTHISDAGIEHLRAMAGLTALILSGTALTDAAVPGLANMKRLKKLNIRGTRITPEGAAALERALPHCHISYSAHAEIARIGGDGSGA